MKHKFLIAIVFVLVTGACRLFGGASPASDEPSAIEDTENQVEVSLPTATPTTNQKLNSSLFSEMEKQPPSEGTTHLYGQVRLSDQPVYQITDYLPGLEIWDRVSNELLDYKIDYDSSTSEYLILNLPPGEYKLATLMGAYQIPKPGDFHGMFNYVTIKDTDVGNSIRENIYITRIIHLTSPFNNNEPADPQPGEKYHTEFADEELLIKWDPVPKAVKYKLYIREAQSDTGTFTDTIVVQENITSTSYKADLPPNKANHYYQLKLYAFDSAEIRIGQYIEFYENGSYTFGYKFRVK